MNKTFSTGFAALIAAGLMSAVTLTSAYAQDTQAAAQDPQAAALAAQTQALKTEGKPLFLENCAPCHGENGGGGNGPKLDGNPFVKTRSNIINQVLFGAVDHGMPPFGPQLSDHEIAAIATYVRNSWANDYGPVLDRSVELRRQAKH